MIRCPVCGHENYAGEDACEECGGDLRTLDIPQDAADFHASFRAACDRHDPGYYDTFKAWCDRYFYLPHRQVQRP